MNLSSNISVSWLRDTLRQLPEAELATFSLLYGYAQSCFREHGRAPWVKFIWSDLERGLAATGALEQGSLLGITVLFRLEKRALVAIDRTASGDLCAKCLQPIAHGLEQLIRRIPRIDEGELTRLFQQPVSHARLLAKVKDALK